jgi:hypothetical protein
MKFTEFLFYNVIAFMVGHLGGDTVYQFGVLYYLALIQFILIRIAKELPNE